MILNITLCLNPLFTAFVHSQSFNSGSYIKITRIYHYRHTKRTTLYVHVIKQYSTYTIFIANYIDPIPSTGCRYFRNSSWHVRTYFPLLIIVTSTTDLNVHMRRWYSRDCDPEMNQPDDFVWNSQCHRKFHFYPAGMYD